MFSVLCFGVFGCVPGGGLELFRRVILSDPFWRVASPQPRSQGLSCSRPPGAREDRPWKRGWPPSKRSVFRVKKPLFKFIRPYVTRSLPT